MPNFNQKEVESAMNFLETIENEINGFKNNVGPVQLWIASCVENKSSIISNLMTQDKLWLAKYNEIVSSIETNKRNPSKHHLEEH